MATNYCLCCVGSFCGFQVFVSPIFERYSFVCSLYLSPFDNDNLSQLTLYGFLKLVLATAPRMHLEGS